MSDRTTSDLEHALKATPECVPVERSRGAAERARAAARRRLRAVPERAGVVARVRGIESCGGRRRGRSVDRRRAWTPARRRGRGRGAFAVRLAHAGDPPMGGRGWRHCRHHERGLSDLGSRAGGARISRTRRRRIGPIRLDVRGPVGDLTSAARRTRVGGTTRRGQLRYRGLRGRSHATLAYAPRSISRAELPPSVVRQLLPGKAVLWEVRALNGASQVIAESGTQRFRVAVTGSTPKD